MTVAPMPINPITPIIRRASRLLPDRKTYEATGLEKIDVRLVVSLDTDRVVDLYVVWARTESGVRFFGVDVERASKRPGREISDVALLGPCERTGAWVLVDHTEVVAEDEYGEPWVPMAVVLRVELQRYEDDEWRTFEAADTGVRDPFVDTGSVA